MGLVWQLKSFMEVQVLCAFLTNHPKVLHLDHLPSKGHAGDHSLTLGNGSCHTIIVWNWRRSAMCCAVKLGSAVGITHAFYLGYFQLIMLLSEPPYQRLRNTWDWMHNSSTHWPTLYFLLSTLYRWSHVCDLQWAPSHPVAPQHLKILNLKLRAHLCHLGTSTGIWGRRKLSVLYLCSI